MTTYKDRLDGRTSKLTLAEILEIMAAGYDLPLKFTAYDGSSAGPAEADNLLEAGDKWRAI